MAPHLTIIALMCASHQSNGSNISMQSDTFMTPDC